MNNAFDVKRVKEKKCFCQNKGVSIVFWSTKCLYFLCKACLLPFTAIVRTFFWKSCFFLSFWSKTHLLPLSKIRKTLFSGMSIFAFYRCQVIENTVFLCCRRKKHPKSGAYLKKCFLHRIFALATLVHDYTKPLLFCQDYTKQYRWHRHTQCR